MKIYSWNVNGIRAVVRKGTFQDFVKKHRAFDGWKILHVDRFADRDLEAVDQIVLLLPEKDPGQMAELNVYICAEDASPKEFFLQLLAQSNSMEIRRTESVLPGAIVFSNPDRTTHFIQYHQLLCLVRSVGKKPISTTTMAKAVGEYFDSLRSGDERLSSLSTSTAFVTNEQLRTGELNMAHKLATTFTCHLGGNISGLEEQGHMNLSSMTPDGELANGIYYSPGGNRTLRGEAIGGSPLLFLVLREFDGVRPIAIYEAQLVHETADGRLMLAGKRRAVGAGGGGPAGAALANQNETPWVITKP